MHSLRGRKRRAWGEAGFGGLPGPRWPRVEQCTAEQASGLSMTLGIEARGGGQDPWHARQGGSRSDMRAQAGGGSEVQPSSTSCLEPG